MTRKIQFIIRASFGSLFLFLTACTATLPDVGRSGGDRGGDRSYTKPPMKVVRPVVKPTTVRKPVSKPSKPVRTRPVVRSPIVVNVVKPEKAETGANPYDNVPKSRQTVKSEAVVTRGEPTSPAVTSLLLRAKVDIAAANYDSGISKLERAIRIEPQNAEVWHQLAKANYKQGKYSSSISMATKANRYTAVDSEQEKSNWALIKKASKKSGDIKTLKKAIQYERAHP